MIFSIRQRTARILLLTSTALVGLPGMALAQEIIDGGAMETVIGAGGGTQASPWNIGGNLVVGNLGTGTLNISDGGAVNNTSGFIGYDIGSTGTVTVTGAASSWNNSASLRVGEESDGSLTISNGGAVTSAMGYIGAEPTGNGTVTVDGSASSWTNATEIYVAGAGTGTLTISGGGEVISGSGAIGVGAGSIGAAAITGAGSGWMNSGALLVGESGTGTMMISDGGAVSNTNGYLGYNADSMGTATVTGMGSSWASSGALRVGYAGTGVLDISAGGAVVGSFIYLGGDAGANGTATVTGTGSSLTTAGDLRVGDAGIGTMMVADGGAVSNLLGSIGRSAGSIGTMTVTGPGSTWTNSSDLYVGELGTGTLTVADGGAVSNVNGLIGDTAGSTGTVVVTGTGSTWTNANNLLVGLSGTGALDISAGGVVGSQGAAIGLDPSGSGAVAVTDAGSIWMNTGGLIVGSSGTGTFDISDGGMVSNTFGLIGNSPGSTGTVTVDGVGSSWANSGDLTVGGFGTGTLMITDGGEVSNADSIIGISLGSTSTAIVDGAGSSWTNMGDLRIGDLGTGTLTISNGGTVSAASVTIAVNAPSSVGTLNIGADSGDAAVAAGTLDSANLVFGDGAGALVFNHTDSAYTFASDISGTGGSGTILHQAGVTSYTGDSSAFSGITAVTGGEFYANNILGGTVIVNNNGILGGSGTLTGALTIGNGGTIAPGNSIGTLNVVNITIDPGSTYQVEVNSAGNSDLINAGGTATINGGDVVVVPFPDFVVDTPYTILTALSGVTGTFDTASLGAGSLFITPTLTYDATNTYVLLTQTADFASIAMTPNQIAAAGGAQSLGSGDPLFSAIASQSDVGEARAAFDAISGEIHASVKTALLDDGRFPREAALSRLRVALGGADGNTGQIAAETPQGTNLWIEGFGSSGRWNNDGNAAQLDRAIGGAFIGADAEVASNVTLGLMGGYSRSGLSVDDRASSATVDSYTLGAYAGGNWDDFSLKGGVAHSWHSLDTARSVAFTGFSDSLSASYNARTFQAYTEAAYSIAVGNIRFEPFANLAHVNLSTDGFTETGGAAALAAAASNANATFTTLGIRGETQVDLDGMDATFSGGLGWRHAFGDTPTATHSFAAAGNAFIVAGVPLARDMLVLDAGVEVNLTEDATFGISYNGQLGSGVSDHGAKASLNIRF